MLASSICKPAYQDAKRIGSRNQLNQVYMYNCICNVLTVFYNSVMLAIRRLITLAKIY